MVMHQCIPLLVIFFGLFTIFLHIESANAFVLMPVADKHEPNVNSVKRVVLPKGKGRGKRSTSQNVDSLKRLVLPPGAGRGK